LSGWHPHEGGSLQQGHCADGPAMETKNNEHDKCNVAHTEWCTKMILHTNLGVEKGSVNDIVGIRVLQQLLKVRPAEQEQFMYYDSFGIVREKL